MDLIKSDYPERVENATLCQIDALKKGNTILTAGNGGSAADAQHFAAELVGRFKKERRGWPSIALTTDSSIITSIANDYSYDVIFSRQVEAIGENGDVLIGISTSGNSQNIINAFLAAKKHGIKTVGLLGKDGGALLELCDYPIVIPCKDTPRIQELHIFTIHLMCEMIENELCK